ncbi:MAG TPA: hypothetical protein VF533_10420 [Solirubrobacteraceae bacterium]|jgi:hypothetical protein
MSASPVRPELGPTLPALLRARFGIRPRTTLAVAAAIVVALALLVLLLARENRGTLLVHRGDPTFGVLYSAPVRPATPHAGELMRLAARGKAVRLTLSVAPLPPGTRADLPIRAARYVEALRGRFPGFVPQYDARARVNDAPGYEVRFRAGSPARPLIGQDLLVVPSDESRGPGVIVSLRQRNARPRLRAADRAVVKATKKALRSFSFGADGP